jgi:membrane associated rhomboid family serine protease
MDETPGDMPEQEREEPRREPVFNLAGIIVAIVAVCVGVHLIRYYLLDAEQDFGLILRFAFIPVRYTGGFALDIYSFVSPFTYSLLHGGLAHLAINIVWLAAFGSPLAHRIGALRFLLFWAATALGAVALHLALYPDSTTPLVGASGSISGMMGAAARFAFRIDRTGGRPAFAGPILSIPQVLGSRQAVTFLVVWLAVNLIVGLGFGAPGMESQIAWEAHIGGFLVGFFGLRLFDRRSPAMLPPE